MMALTQPFHVIVEINILALVFWVSRVGIQALRRNK